MIDKGLTFCIIIGIDLHSKTQFGVFTILRFMANIQHMLSNTISVYFIKFQFIYFSLSLNFQRFVCSSCFACYCRD